MKALFEFTGFLGVSVAVHLALWQGAPEGASAAAGAGGAATITLSGGSQTLTALVADWDRPPAHLADITPAAMQPAADSAPALMAPRDTQVPAQAAPPSAPTPPGAVPVAPAVDTAPPPARFAPRTSPRPEPRPEPVAKAEPKPKPKAKPKPQRAAPPKQTAAGKGGSRAAGTANKPGAGAKTSSKASARQMARWGGTIRARVERRKRFPPGASGRGKVGLWLRVTTSGQLAGVGLTRSSGNAAFDRAALNAVRAAALPRAPGGIAPGAYRFSLSMAFAR